MFLMVGLLEKKIDELARGGTKLPGPAAVEGTVVFVDLLVEAMFLGHVLIPGYVERKLLVGTSVGGNDSVVFIQYHNLHECRS